MTMSDRGIHPDLLEETLAARAEQAAPQEAPRDAGGRRARRAAPPPEIPSPEPPSGGSDAAGEVTMPDAPAAEGEAPAPTEAPDWRAQLREAKDDAEILRLVAKHLPLDQIEKDEVFSGKIGTLVSKRLMDRDREQLERQKREAAANNDLYTLGELAQRDYQQEVLRQQQAQQSAPFMESVARFQQKLPEPVQQRVSGQSFDSVEHYLQVLTDEAVNLRVEQELHRREAALRKSILSEVNGDAPVPERENGTPNRVREVTDEQIANMSLAEYNALFDENGRPKPGVQHRSTRGIPIRSH